VTEEQELLQAEPKSTGVCLVIRGTTIEDWKLNLVVQAAGKLVHEGEVGKILINEPAG
jgi:hypothetical protein